MCVPNASIRFILSGVVVVVCQVGVLAGKVKLSIGSCVVPGVLVIAVVTSPVVEKSISLSILHTA